MTDSPIELSDQRVLILGGTSGIGLTCARAFVAEGALVRIVGRSETRGRQAAAELGERSGFLAADCSDPEAVEAVFNSAIKELGGISTMICSLGGNHLPELLFKIPIADIRAAMLSDVAPFLYAGRAAVPIMMAQEQGCIINIASDAGKVATPGETVIGAGMAAIMQFTRGMALEGKRNGIRANVLTPSLVEGTPLTDRLMEEGRFSAKLFAKARPHAELGATYPEDLAVLALFLASPAAAKITGQAISVNGGISAA